MKRLIILGLGFLFLATTFSSNPPPGWYPQQLPVNDQTNDMFFLDNLRGWIITERNTGSAYILQTSDGGENWNIQFQQLLLLTAIQFIDSNVGYVVGSEPPGIVLKTTNGGSNWFTVAMLATYPVRDLSFINKDTGWICSDDLDFGGVFKTTNGGQNWTRQLDQTYKPAKIFFINKDTGWMGNVPKDQLYKTTNGGINWNFLVTFPNMITDILFINKDSGWISQDVNEVKFTSDGGNNWVTQFLPPEGGMIITSRSEKISTIDGKTIWAVGGNVFYGMGRFRGIIYKSTNSGNNWFYQIPDTSIQITRYKSIQFVNDSTGWAANTGVIHTLDGGGPVVNINNNNLDLPKDFILYQNYPNPFNPNTIIKYQITSFSKVVLKIYDVKGGEISELINENQSAGIYEYTFNGSELPSGIYFYRLEAIGDDIHYLETKKMLLIK